MALPRKQLQFRNGAHTVDDNDDRVEREALLERLDLLQQRLRITRIAGKHRDGHWAAARMGEQTVFDLQRARLAVARIAAHGQRTAAPFNVTGGERLEHPRALVQIALGQALLDDILGSQQPTQCRMRVVLVGFADPEQLRQRRVVSAARGDHHQQIK